MKWNKNKKDEATCPAMLLVKHELQRPMFLKHKPTRASILPTNSQVVSGLLMITESHGAPSIGTSHAGLHMPLQKGFELEALATVRIRTLEPVTTGLRMQPQQFFALEAFSTIRS